MVSRTLRCSFEPPVTLVTASLAFTSGTAPHGAAFCGSPRSFSTIQVAGSSSLKWAWTTAGAAVAAAVTSANSTRADFFIDIPSLESGTTGPGPSQPHLRRTARPLRCAVRKSLPLLEAADLPAQLLLYEPHDFRTSLRPGEVERSFTAVRLQCQVGTGFDNHACRVDMVLPDCIVQRGVAVLRPLFVDVDAAPDEQARRFGTPGVGGSVQSRRAHSRVDRAHVGACVEQRLDDAGVTQVGGHDQRCVAVGVELVDVRATCDQCLYASFVIVVNRLHQCS